MDLSETSRRWAVLGGGMLGITVALELARDGHQVTLYESSDRLGGLAAPWRLGDVVWDRHYHVTLLSDSALRGLLAEIDLEREIKWVTTKTGFYGNGRLYSMSNGFEFLRFPLLGLSDKLRLAATIMYASRLEDGRKLEKLSVEEWLTTWSGRSTFEKIWLPLLRSKLGNSYRRVSAAFIWATIRRLYAARRQGLKKELFGYVPGGYARVLDRLQTHLEANGVEIRLGTSASSIEPDEGDGVRIRFTDGTREHFASAILTMPAPVAASLCSVLTNGEKERLNGIEYQGIVCTSLLLRRGLADYYVTNITDDGLPFTGVIEMTALVDESEFGGRALVYLPRYLSPDDPYFELTDEQIEAQCIGGLKRMYPNFRSDDIVSCRISRVRRVFALPTLDYSKRLPDIQTSVPGLYILNSAHIVSGTLNVDETIRLAQRSMTLLKVTESRRNLAVRAAASL